MSIFTLLRQPGIAGLLLLVARLGTAQSLPASLGQPTPAPPLGAAAAYGLLSGTSLTATAGGGGALPIRVLGSAGAGGGVSASVQASTGVYAQGAGTVPDALADAREARDYCGSLGGTSLGGNLDEQVLRAGAYAINGNAGLGNGARLTLSGDTATVIVLNVAGSLALEEQAQVVLDGVLPRHVFWNVSGNLQVAASTRLAGVLLIGGAASLTGFHFGDCAILSEGTLQLTDVSDAVGHNQFFAPARPAATCDDGSQAQSCLFTPPPGELMLDGSFEAYRCPPFDLSGLSLAPADACFWRSGNAGTADYFHANATGPRVSVPYNRAGWQSGYAPGAPAYALGQNSTTQRGQGYAGFYAYSTLIINRAPYREYVAQASTARLLAGHRYYGEFSVQLAQASGWQVGQLGMALVATSAGYPSPSLTPILLSPQVSGSPTNPLTAGQPANWHRLGQVFVPSQDLTGFTVLLGNFEASPTFTNNGPSQFTQQPDDFSRSAYYYLDNVTLSLVTEAGDPVVLGATCLGGNGASSTTLGTLPMPALVGATYTWTASPADPSLSASVANPTVSPGQTTTYTLTVSIPGQAQTYASSVTVQVASPSYGQNAGATYVAGPGRAPYELGTANTTTTLDANGGTVTFDGRYRVRGNVRFTNGTYALRPGTVFFIDTDNTSDNAPTIRLEVQQATLRLSGATLRATTCDGSRWEGITLAGSGLLQTAAFYGLSEDIPTDLNGQRSLIRDMRLGINSRAGNQYDLSGTDFTNNGTSLYEFAKDKVAQPGEGVRNCTFTDGDYGLVLGEDDYYAGHVNGGDYSQAQFSGNTFRSLAYYGVYAASGLGHFENNTFRSCGRAAMVTWSTPDAGPAEFSNNVIEVPAAGPQGSAGNAPVGIDAGDPRLLVTGNTLTGASGLVPTATTTNPRVGVAFVDDIDGSNANQVSGNTFSHLDVGLSAPANKFRNHTIAVRGNTFQDNAVGLAIPSAGTNSYNPPFTVIASVRCNSFVNTAGSPVSDPIGLWVQNGAVIDDGFDTSPNGNAFQFQSGQTRLIVNDGANPISYQPYKSIVEEDVLRVSGIKKTGGGSGGSILPGANIPSGGACSGVAGVQNQRTMPAAPSVFAEQLDSLSRRDLSPAIRLRLVQRTLAGAMEPPQLAALEALPAVDEATDGALGLGLLAAYRQHHDLPGADRLRARLRAAPPAADTELAAYLRLTEALDQMPSFLPGLRPLRASVRVLLGQVAASGTASAGPACHLLRAYEPTCPCQLPTASASQRPTAPAASRPKLRATALAAYPNPASTVLHVPLSPAGSSTAELRVYDATGRLVAQHAVAPAASELTLDVRGWASGLYQLVLVGDGQVMGTQRLAVTPLLTAN